MAGAPLGAAGLAGAAGTLLPFVAPAPPAGGAGGGGGGGGPQSQTSAQWVIGALRDQMLAAGVASQRQMGQSSEGGLSLGLGAFGVGTSPPVSFSVPQVPGAPKVAPAVRVPMVQGQPPALIPQSTSFQEQLQGLLSFSQQAAQGQQVLQGLGGGSLRGGVPPQLLPYLPAPAAAAAAAAAVNAAAAAVAAPPDETYCCGVRQVAQPNVHALERLYASGPVSGLPKPPKSGQVATGGGERKNRRSSANRGGAQSRCA